MCGRFTLTVTPEELQNAFPDFHVPPDLPPSYNIAPSQPVAVFPNLDGKQMTFYSWGLVPSWTKEDRVGKFALINARGETLAEKPSFRSAYRRRRCLIPADGFFEWREETPHTKTPYYIRRKDQGPFAFAGLWEIWHSSLGDELRTCCIITTKPNELIQDLHHRMPVILAPAEYDRWLTEEEQPPGELDDLLDPFPAEQLEAYPVSTYVNSPQNNSPKTIEPAQRPWQPSLDL
jgi:putative SOS response-associated peptidase YedK